MEDSAPAKLYNPVQTVILTVFIYFASQLAAGVLISAIPAARHWTSAHTTDWLTNNVWATFVFVLLVESVTLGLLYQILRQRKLGFKSLGLNRPAVRYVAYALSGFAVYFVLYIIILIIAKQLVPTLDLEQKQELGFSANTTGASLLPVFVSLVILPPVTEEIVVRGFLFGGLRTKLPFLVSAVIASTLFAAAHLGEGGSGAGLLWVAGIDTFILSLVLCYLREKTNSLWPSIGVHMLKNCLAFIVLFNIFQYVR